MKKIVLALLALVLTSSAFGQEPTCYERLEKAFEKRGAYTVADDLHRNVIISFFEGEDVFCVKGKARVENGVIESIFVYYNDNTSELYEKKFWSLGTNNQKKAPTIENGITEMIYTADKEKLKIIFIDKLKPKSKKFKPAELPDDL